MADTGIKYHATKRDENDWHEIPIKKFMRENPLMQDSEEKSRSYLSEKIRSVHDLAVQRMNDFYSEEAYLKPIGWAFVELITRRPNSWLPSFR